MDSESTSGKRGNSGNQYPHSVLSSFTDVAQLRPWGDEKFSAALFDCVRKPS